MQRTTGSGSAVILDTERQLDKTTVSRSLNFNLNKGLIRDLLERTSLYGMVCYGNLNCFNKP